MSVCENVRRLHMETLEDRRMLAVATSLISQAATHSMSPSGSSQTLAASRDGRFVVFQSDAPNVVPDYQSSLGSQNVYRHDRLTGQTILVSISTSGGGSNGKFEKAAISNDGNVIAFASTATNLSPLDTSDNLDIFVRDVAAGTTSLATVNILGIGNSYSHSTSPSLSADGRIVAFTSTASDLDTRDFSDGSDIFARDLSTQVTQLISIGIYGVGGGHRSVSSFDMSDDGSVIAFVSSGADIHPLDQDGDADIFVRNITLGTTDLVSVNAAGLSSGNGHSRALSISGDGKRIAFESISSDLHPLDHNTELDLFVRDLDRNATELISINTTGGSSSNSASHSPFISRDGNIVAFSSSATDLSELDSNSGEDLFARNLTTGTTHLITVNSAGTEGVNSYEDPYRRVVLSADGRFISYSSDSSDLSESDSDGAFLYKGTDVFVRDLELQVTQLVSLNASGLSDGNNESTVAAISDDGNVIVFDSFASDLVSGDGNLRRDVFTHDRGAETTTLISESFSSLASNTANEMSAVGAHSVSADGRYIAFVSRATNLVDGLKFVHNEPAYNVYRYDRVTKSTELVSINFSGDGGGNGWSDSPSISADGRMIVFRSHAKNLTQQFGSGEHNVFVRDMDADTTTLISSFRGQYGPGTNGAATISANGRVVSFLSNSTATHPLKNTSKSDAFAFDLDTGELHFVTIAADGRSGGNGHAFLGGDMSADGSVIVFMSGSTNLHPLDTGSLHDVYARNIFTGVTSLVSVNATETGSGNRESRDMAVSHDGTKVAFVSEATNLVALDTLPGPDVYLRDLLTGETQLVSVNATETGGTDSEGNSYVSISADGNVVVYGFGNIFARNLSTGTSQVVGSNETGDDDGSDYYPVISADGDTIAFRSGSRLHLLDDDQDRQYSDIYVRKLSTGSIELLSVNSSRTGAGNGSSMNPAISADGKVVVFFSEATDLVERDWNQAVDVFVASFVNDSELPGDYNLDGRVDAADYTVWRNAMGQTGLVPYSGADGSGNGSVGPEDHTVWKSHFGESIEQGAGSLELGVKTEDLHPLAAAPYPHPLDSSRPLPEGEAGRELLGATRLGGTAFIGLEAGTKSGAAGFGELSRNGVSPFRWRAASAIDDVRRVNENALLAWCATREGVRAVSDEFHFEDSESADMGGVDAVFARLADGMPTLSSR